VAAVVELGEDEDDAEPDPDFASDVDPDGVDPDSDPGFDPDSGLPFERGSFPARLSVR